MIKKKVRPLVQRQGGRHKEEWYDSGEKKRVIEKECRTCKVVKKAKEFYASPSCRDGLRKDCIPCDNRIRAERRKEKHGRSKTELPGDQGGTGAGGL